MIRKLLVNGRAVEVRLDGEGRFQADEREGTVSMVEAEPGVWSVLLDGRSYEVYTEPDAVTVNGSRISVEVVDPRAVKRGRGAVSLEGRQVLTAAMPGKVVRILVQPGDTVEAGQGVAVVEAMKMQNEVKSPRTGRVVSVSVAEGAAVAAGAVLAVVE